MPLAVALHWVVLAQGMPIPVFGHHDAAQVGVAAEVNAEQVEDLALVKVSRGPDWCDAVEGRRVAVETDDKAQTFFQRHGKNVINDLEARLGGIPVDGGDILEEVVTGPLYGFAGRDDAFARDGDRQLVAV